MADNLQQGARDPVPKERIDDECVTTTRPPPLDEIPKQQSTSVTTTADITTTASSFARKATVGVTGGLITAVGLVMIPAPTPFGCVVAAYGASILATEFEGAQDVLESGKKKLQDGLEVLADKLQENDEYLSSNDDNNKNNSNADVSQAESEEEGEEVVLVSDEDGDNNYETVEDEEQERSLPSEPLLSKSIDYPDAAANAVPPPAAPASSVESEVELRGEERESEEDKGKDAGLTQEAPSENDQQEDGECENNHDQEEEEADGSDKSTELPSAVTGEQDVVQKAQDVWRLHSNNMRKVSIHAINNVLLPALRDLNFRPRKAGPGDDDGDQQSVENDDKTNNHKIDDSQRTEVTLDETVHATRSSSENEEDEVPGSAESVVSISTVEDNSPLVVEALQELVEALQEEH